MLGTINEIRNPGVRALPPGVERYFVKGGGLSVIEAARPLARGLAPMTAAGVAQQPAETFESLLGPAYP